MFRKNQSHLQPGLFSPENRMTKPMQTLLKNHWSGVFYEKVFKPLDEDIFAPIYCDDNGRPNFPVNILACLEVLKELQCLTDEQLYENYIFNYTFHRAFGIENIEDYFFDLRTIYNFRSRLAEYESQTGENLFLKVFKDGRDRIIEELGIKTGTQRVDSVMIAANIKRMSRLMLFQKVLLNLIREIQKQNIPLSEVYTDLVKEDEDSIAYRLSREKVPERLRELGERIHQLVLRFRDFKPVSKTKGYRDAVRLLEEQCRIEYGTVKIKDPDDIDSSCMQNPSDGDATYRRKGNDEYQGYTAHAVETCDPENQIQVITCVQTVKNNIDDAVVLAEELPALKHETDVDTMISDGGYVSDDVRDVCEEENVVLVASAIRGKEMPEDALTSIDFHLDDMGLIESCPADQSPVSRGREKDGTVYASFDVRICNSCQRKDRCIAYKSEKHSRIVIDRHRLWLDQRQELLETEGYKTLCRMRPPVEGLMEKLKPKYLNGRMKFRGLIKVRGRMVMRAIGLNFRRYLLWVLYFLFGFEISGYGLRIRTA